MPNLPVVPIPTQAQFDRITATFPGATAADKVEAYRRWVRNLLIDRVEIFEARQIDEEANTAKIGKLQTLRDSLPSRYDTIDPTAPVETPPVTP